jgi:hypothetical protein
MKFFAASLETSKFFFPSFDVNFSSFAHLLKHTNFVILMDLQTKWVREETLRRSKEAPNRMKD